ncbi:hypothetical protein ACQWTT_001289 [Acinetobacter baumannii]
MKLIFDFDNKEDSFFAGFLFNLMGNVFQCAFFLCVYLLTYLRHYESIGLIFFIIFLFSMINLGRFYALVVYSMVNKQNRALSKFDIGSIVSLIIFVCIIIYTGSIKFNLFPLNKDTIDIVYTCIMFATVALCGSIFLPEKLGYRKINFTFNESELDNKSFYINKKSFNMVRVLFLGLPIIFIPLLCRCLFSYFL